MLKDKVLSILSTDACNDLAAAAVRIIEQIGVRVTHPDAAALLLDAGAKKADDARFRMGESMLRDLLAKAPRQFGLHHRGGGCLDIGSGRSWTFCGATVAQVADWPDWSLRKATRLDAARFTRLCDALPLVHCLAPVVEAQDVDSAMAEPVTYVELLSNTSKFAWVCPVKHSSARTWIEMGRIATGVDDLSVNPKVGLLSTVLPDLYLDDDCAATALLAAREGIPLISMAGPIGGMSAPNTIAGIVSLKLAPELFLAALVQIVRPGSPVLLDVGAVALDMNTADLDDAGPEASLGVIAMAQVVHSFHLPTYSCALGCDSKIGDYQAGMEKMAGLLTARLAGVDLTTNIGLISRGNVASYEQILLDHELCAFVDRIGSGVQVNEDTLAWDVIQEVGIGGEFLAHEHTLRHCRSGEIWHPTLLDRTAPGSPREDPLTRAHIRAENLMEDHRPSVDPGLGRDLERWLALAARR